MTLIMFFFADADWTQALITGGFSAVSAVLATFFTYLRFRPKDRADIGGVDATTRQTDAATLREVQLDVQRWVKNYDAVSGRVRVIELNSDIRYRKLRNFMLDVVNLCDRIIPALAECESGLPLIPKIEATRAKYILELESEEKKYEEEFGEVIQVKL